MADAKIITYGELISATTDVIPDNQSVALDIESTDGTDYLNISTADGAEGVTVTVPSPGSQDSNTGFTVNAGAGGNIFRASRQGASGAGNVILMDSGTNNIKVTGSKLLLQTNNYAELNLNSADDYFKITDDGDAEIFRVTQTGLISTGGEETPLCSAGGIHLQTASDSTSPDPTLVLVNGTQSDDANKRKSTIEFRGVGDSQAEHDLVKLEAFQGPGGNNQAGCFEVICNTGGGGFGRIANFNYNQTVQIGVCDGTPLAALHVRRVGADIRIDNIAGADTAAARLAGIEFFGRRSGDEAVEQGQIHFAHEGTSDDDKSYMVIETNDGTSSAERLRIASDGNVDLIGNSAIGPEHLDETDFSSHAEWDVAGDFSDSGGDATYTHSSGAGTLTQVQADLALAIPGDRYYVLTYVVSGVSGSDMAATLTTGVATEAVTLTVTANGTYTAAFKAKATPGDFVISATSTTGGTTFTLDDVSLKSCAGTLTVGERINCTDGGINLRIGDADTGAALAASTGTYNTCIGPSAGKVIATGVMNTAVGPNAGKGLVSSIESTFVGYNAGQATTNSKNTAIGAGALAATCGASNTAVGKEAAMLCTGVENTIMGCSAAGYNNATLGSYNVAMGFQALLKQDSAGDGKNTAIGWKAGDAITSTHTGTYIGASTAASAATSVENETCLGYAAVGNGSDTVTLGDDQVSALYCEVTSITGISDARVKDNVEDSALGLDFISALRPVKYQKKHPSEFPEEIRKARWSERTNTNVEDDGTVTEYTVPADEKPSDWQPRTEYGLIAQEVKAAMESHSATDWQGHAVTPNGTEALGYGALVIVLVKAVQELTSRIEELENDGD